MKDEIHEIERALKDEIKSVSSYRLMSGELGVS